MNIETVSITDLQAHPRNYRGHPQEQIEHLKASLAEYGIVKNIGVASDNVILAGHGLVQAARELGYTELPVYRIAMPSTDPKAQKFMVLDNEVSRVAVDDEDKLAILLKELENDLLGTGYDSNDINSIIADIADYEFSNEQITTGDKLDKSWFVGFVCNELQKKELDTIIEKECVNNEKPHETLTRIIMLRVVNNS